MSILEIKQYDNPILRKKAEEVERIDWQIRSLIDDMRETMQDAGGVGLAAPQVGVLKRIIVVEGETVPIVFIDPVIIKKSRKKISGQEGCLSLPGLVLRVKRAKRIEVEAIDEDGKEIVIKADGLFSRILQHEIDHLDGILFVDRLGFLAKLRIRKKLKEIKKNHAID